MGPFIPCWWNSQGKTFNSWYIFCFVAFANIGQRPALLYTINLAFYCIMNTHYTGRVALGQISALELPAGMLDSEKDYRNPRRVAKKVLEEECGITVDAAELVDLTDLACQEATVSGHLPYPAVAPSGGACDEFVRYFYIEKTVTLEQLKGLDKKLVAGKEFSAFMHLHVVPMERVWKMSGDSKTMMYVHNIFYGKVCPV